MATVLERVLDEWRVYGHSVPPTDCGARRINVEHCVGFEAPVDCTLYEALMRVEQSRARVITVLLSCLAYQQNKDLRAEKLTALERYTGIVFLHDMDAGCPRILPPTTRVGSLSPDARLKPHVWFSAKPQTRCGVENVDRMGLPMEGAFLHLATTGVPPPCMVMVVPGAFCNPALRGMPVAVPLYYGATIRSCMVAAGIRQPIRPVRALTTSVPERVALSPDLLTHHYLYDLWTCSGSADRPVWTCYMTPPHEFRIRPFPFPDPGLPYTPFIAEQEDLGWTDADMLDPRTARLLRRENARQAFVRLTSPSLVCREIVATQAMCRGFMVSGEWPCNVPAIFSGNNPIVWASYFA